MKKTLFSKRFIASILIIAVLYVMVATWMMNIRLIKSAILGSYELSYKISLLTSLLGGMWTAMSGFGLVTLILVALLTGANLTLIFLKIKSLHSQKISFLTYVSSLFGFATSGCAACGLPILSLLGMGGSIIYLPFRGTELSVIALILLLLSFYLLVRADSKEKVCEVK